MAKGGWGPAAGRVAHGALPAPMVGWFVPGVAALAVGCVGGVVVEVARTPTGGDVTEGTFARIMAGGPFGFVAGSAASDAGVVEAGLRPSDRVVTL